MKKRLSLILLNIILCLSALAMLCGYSAFAKADGPTFTVKFWLDENKTQEYRTDENESTEQTVASGFYAKIPETPLKDDNVFLFWQKNGERFSFSKTPITEDTELTAAWYRLKVKFNVEGVGIVNEQIVTRGEDAIAPTSFDLPEGKVFTGWDGEFTNVQQDIVINANITDAEYTVTVIGFDGATVKTFENVKHGTAVDISSVLIPEISNYHVVVGDEFEGSTTDITSDCDILIKYVPNEYVATFYTGSDVYGEPQTVNYGEYVTFPSIPNKTGYIFQGWFGNENCTIPFDFNSFIESNVSIYAKFQAIENKKYDVTFYNYDGVQYGAVQRVEEGKTAIPAGRPTREGYDFLGWFIIDDTRELYDFSTPVTKDISLYAQFKIKDYTVTVMNDGEVVSTQTVKYGGNATEPSIAVKEGYIFTGFDASFKDIRKDTVINATFRLKTFAVMFIDSYGKKMCATQYVEYGKSAKAPKVPELEGYNFLQWSEDYENVTDDIVVVPLYEKITFTVTYITDGAEYDVKTVEYGHLAINVIPEKEGYIFKGWFTDENCETAYDFNAEVTQNIILYGDWELKPVDSYTVTFKVDGAIFAMYSVEQGQNCQRPNDPNKYGYDFVGWDGEFTNVNENLEINAIFTEKEFTVRLTGYQGAGSDDFTVKYNTRLTDDMFPASVPEKEGYTFDGWNYDATQPVTQDITVYAVYNINVYVVTFIVEGEEYDVQYVNYNSYAYIPSQPYVYGKTFFGWYVGENTFNFRLGVTADVEVTAKLGAVKRTIYYYLDNKYYTEEKYEVGAQITVLAAPEIDEHTDFFGWQGIPENMIMPNATVNVYGYTYTHHAYTITYYINGNVYAQETYYDGDAVTALGAPSAEDLTRLSDSDTVFIEWDEVPETMPVYNCEVNAVLQKYYYLTYFIDGYYREVLRVLEGEAITPKAAPELPDVPGYVFMGWENEPQIMPQYNTTVEGTIMRNYTISYYVNGDLYDTVEVFQGNAVTPLGLPTEQYENFVVDGWDNEPETMPMHDVRVDAVIRLKYTVTYYIGNDVCSTVKIPVGDAIPEYIPKTDENTVFVAWLNLPESGTMPAENINVYASVKHYFTLTYVIDEQVYRTFRILEGEPIQLITYENDIEGIIFYEWQDVIDIMTGSDYTITASIKKLHKYALTYYVDGEKFREFEIYEGDTVTPLKETPKFDNPDIVFNGWQGEPSVMPERDVNVYADIKYYYVITYYVHGEVYDTVRAIAGTPVQKHAAPDNLYEYEIFVGWQSEPETMPIGGARVEAVIRTLERHTITYYIDNEVFDTREYYATLPVTPYGVPELEDESRIFDGWDNEPTVMPNYDIDVYGHTHIKEDDLTLNRFMLNTAFADDKELILTFEVTEDVNLAGFTGVIVFDEKAFKDCRIDILDSDYITAAVVDNEVRFAWAYYENITNGKSFITVMLGRTGAGVQGNVSLNIFEAYAFDEEGTAVPVEYSVN